MPLPGPEQATANRKKRVLIVGLKHSTSSDTVVEEDMAIGVEPAIGPLPMTVPDKMSWVTLHLSCLNTKIDRDIVPFL